MNERLRELADQAGFIRFSPEEDPRTPIDWSSDYEHELKRFAELIVRECAELCLKHAEYEGPFQQMEFRKGHHFNTIIKNHFGVKE